MTIWALMLLCGLITFAIRYSFIGAEGHFQPADWFRRLLPLVPIAALTALTVPELLWLDGRFQWANPRLWAGLAAIMVAARWRNTLLTIASGFVAFWLLQFFSG